jgi:hypothetical protein
VPHKWAGSITAADSTRLAVYSIVVIGIWTGLTTLLIAAEKTVRFEEGVQSILRKRCFGCHGDDRTRRKAELDLRTAATILKGGVSGPALVPGTPDGSLMWKQITTGKMPPQPADRLTPQELAVVRAWILGGALSKTAGSDEGIADVDRNFWSFRLLAHVTAPKVNDPNSVATPIDRFLLARLEAQGLSYSPPADRYALIRRASFDLIGLPPSPEEIQAFVADNRPDAYRRLIERLVASPHYGEHWGRHWLDVVGYSDSNGYHRADTPRPLAHRYRDYVIRSFNDDKPYARFWLEQLAGDELVSRQQLQTYSPEVVKLLVATHFLRNGPDGTDSTEGNEIARTIERYAVLEQQLRITMSAMFGLTIDCARCHSHKFDPIPQTDYYSLQAVFYPAFNVKKWVAPKDRSIHVAPREQLAKWQTASKRCDQEIERLKQSFAVWAAAHRSREFAGQLQGKRDELDKAVKAKEAARPGKPGEIAWVTDQSAEPPVVPLLKRGRYFEPGAEVAAGTLSVLCEPGERLTIAPPESGAPTTGRRLAFARWATRRNSRAAALLARVQVNRIWMWHFGRGLIDTPENFGARGLAPSHPQLLEWLATQFMEGGWSTKMLHRQILLSNAYRQGTRPTTKALTVDPDNRLMWGYPVHRLESEAVRDSLLVAAGAFDRRIGGPAVDFAQSSDGQCVVPGDEKRETGSGSRRSVYLRHRRSEPIAFLQTFDQATAEPNCIQRSSATLVSQALVMLNSRFANAMADRFAELIWAEAGMSVERRIRRAYLIAYGRLPAESEAERAYRFLASQTTRYRNAGAADGPAAMSALSDYCQVLLSSNEFLYVR